MTPTPNPVSDFTLTLSLSLLTLALKRLALALTFYLTPALTLTLFNAQATLTVADFLHSDPELESPCAASLGEQQDANLREEALQELRAVTTPVKQLRKLFEKAYTGFDDADWAKVEAWVKADPSK